METKTDKMPATREEAIAKFRKWINQRPGLDPMDYGGYNNYYHQDRGTIYRQKVRADRALDQFSWRTYDPSVLQEAMRYYFSGRLQFNSEGNLSYTAGQYWPTEYRLAAAVVLEAYFTLLNRED